MLSVKQGGSKYHFGVFGITRPWIEPRSRGPLANTLLIRLMARMLEVIIIYPRVGLVGKFWPTRSQLYIYVSTYAQVEVKH